MCKKYFIYRYLNLKYQVWNKSTNDLYDFESDDYIKGEQKIEKEQYLVITDNNKLLPFSVASKLNEHISNNPNDKIIVDISISDSKNQLNSDGKYNLISPSLSKNFANIKKKNIEKLWYVLKKNDYKVKSSLHDRKSMKGTLSK